MNIYIGENIKRLRREKNITQEKLAEHLNVSTQAVSKWERNETYPDITMILPLAGYFGISTDELLGFDAVKNEEKINVYETQYKNLLAKGKWKEAKKLSCEAYKEFPNDFRIIIRHLWEMVGNRADNSPEVLLAHKDKIMMLCERIIEECNIDSIRDDAYSILAKVYKAEGNTEKALEIISRFPNWYGCVKGQECERLFEKGSEDWWYWIHRNMYELSDFAVDKILKIIWFSDQSFEVKIQKIERIITLMLTVYEETKYEPIFAHIMSVYSGIAEKCIRVGKQAEAIKYYDLRFTYAKKFDDFVCSDKSVFNAPKKIKKDFTWYVGKPGQYNMVKQMLLVHDGNPLYDELSKNKDYIAMLNKYRPYAKDLE